tara:strand:+ start:133 stop:495 length:363 start_codon:yes stop_codon:yes gene_type:complete
MKATEFKKLIKESVREVIQEELKEILLEAVRSPKTVVTETTPIQSTHQGLPEDDKVKLRENMMGVLDGMKRGQDTMSFTSADARGIGNSLQVQPGMDTTNGSLPEGNVGMDQIMALMKSK